MRRFVFTYSKNYYCGTSSIARLQDYIQRQDASKNDILQNLARKGDMDSAKLSEEAKRLNDKIQLITNEVTRNMTEREQRMRDENQQKYQTLEKVPIFHPSLSTDIYSNFTPMN